MEHERSTASLLVEVPNVGCAGSKTQVLVSISDNSSNNASYFLISLSTTETIDLKSEFFVHRVSISNGKVA